MSDETIHIIEKRDTDLSKRCKHFTGIMQDSCKAGVVYASVKKLEKHKYRYKNSPTVYTSRVSLPCIADDNFAGCVCDKFETLTADEIAAHEAKWKRAFQETVVARMAIVKHTGGKRGVAGQMPCPVCSAGQLGFSVADSNGHIHARCTTDGCVSWME